MKSAVKKILHGIVVSCQAYEDTPLYGPENMAKMAECAVLGGAAGVRACWPQDVKAIREKVNVPIIGINKKFGGGDPLDEIFITPDFRSAKDVIEAGCDILALDCTIRPVRPFSELERLLKQIHNTYPDIAVMADLATVEEAEKVAATGYVDIISTTLAGYTRQSNQDPHVEEGPSIETLRQIKKRVSLPVNAEGRIWDSKDLEKVLEAGADIVCIGTAITRPHLITERFVKLNLAHRKNDIS